MSINQKSWIKLEGELPPCGYYEVKINNKILKGGAVKLINTYEGDDLNKKLHGFCISTLTVTESDERERDDWQLKSDYLFLKNVTHYKQSSYDKEMRYIDGHFYRYIEMDDDFYEDIFDE
jgi:hypothetical protein